MRALSLLVQIGLFAAVAAAAFLALREIGMRWDDWVVLGVVALGVVWVAQMLWDPEYPSRTVKRRFGRSSGPDAPTPTTSKDRRER